MNKTLSLALLVALTTVGCATTHPSLPTQENVDLSRYVGTWYEQARLPHRFQQDCAGEVRADYVLQAEGSLGVTNQCRTASGETKVAQAVGRLAKAEPSDPAKLEVRFAPAWTSWLPMVWGDYWILRVEGDYQHALVGTPDREYLWVLSRDKQADPSLVSNLLNYAENLGFPVNAVQRTQP